jgi:hypothetical protein
MVLAFIFAMLLTANSALSVAGMPGLEQQTARSGTVSGDSHDVQHRDHSPKHGGTFFMAMDNHHHLEGVLEPSGIFRVYLYDGFTRPLSAGKMAQAHGTVLVGDSENRPEIPLVLSRDGRTLEAAPGKAVALQATLTLLLSFPGTPREAKPEVFTFPASDYLKPRGVRLGGSR